MPPAKPPRRRRAHAPETPVEAREGEVLVWTDGACRGNPGPGGWAAIVVAGGRGARGALRRRAADDQQPDGVHRRARGPALAARRAAAPAS